MTDDHPNRDRSSRDRPSRDREGADPAAYLITCHTYGSWLHGDDSGSVDRRHNVPGTRFVPGNPARRRQTRRMLTHSPVELTVPQRTAVQEALLEVCQYRAWSLLAVHVRTNHFHAVVVADRPPEKVMNDFKSYATRRLRSERLVDEESKVWSRHGSTRYLWSEAEMQAAVEYTLNRQGAPLIPLPHGRGSV